jgi:flagellin-like hook-associated protein FlgL
VREDISGELQDFKQEIVTAAQTYTNNLTEKLKLELDSQFETMMRTLNNTRKMLNGVTPTRVALYLPRDSPN